MKASLNWLKEFVSFDIDADELARRLTLAGLEVKEIKVIGGSWDNIVIGQITAVEPHPNADRLRLVTVLTGEGPVTVVSGAPNLNAGDKIPFARVGAELIDGHTGEKSRLKTAKIRGVASSGMVCSEKELGLSESHEGIMVLPADAPVGAALADYLGDAIFDLEVTPNRADCLSILGLAHEAAALTGSSVVITEPRYEEPGPAIENQVSVEIKDPVLCPRYCASLISGVKTGPSPDWMQRRLTACGMRPINIIVDITNYVMLEHGQPLHAFDFNRITGRKIIVRRAAPGEALVSLDGVTRALDDSMLVIADAVRPVAIAGVMGGADSEVTDSTTDILLEAANFKPSNIYYTGHRLGLPSEARLRFERGLRPELTIPALRRATQLMVELGGGKAAKGIVDIYPGRRETPPVRLSLAQTMRILGVDFGAEQVRQSLTALGFVVTPDGNGFLVTPPCWRNDIRIEVDLIEEVARITGYDRIPTTMLAEPIPHHTPNSGFHLQRQVKDLLAGCGFYEQVSYSLVGIDSLERLSPERQGPSATPLRVANPMTTDQEYLRPTLRANVLGTYAANRRHEDGGIRIYELDKVYLPSNGLPDEPYVLCAALGGPRVRKSWYGGGDTLDFFDAKGMVESLLDKLGICASFQESDDITLHPKKQAAITADGRRLGVVGEVHPAVLASFEIPEVVALFEIELAALAPLIGTRQFRAIPKFPAVTRDIALIVDRQVTHRQTGAIIESFPLVQNVELFDMYSGDPIPAGKKSLAYRIVFQSAEHTLTDEEVDRVQQQILDRLAKEVSATLRS